MPYPLFFYYTEKSMESGYKKEPPGSLEVDRLAMNQPAWKELFSSEVPKPKCLILADWTARFWTEEKINHVIEKIAELINDGFSILLWQDGDFKILSREFLACLSDKKIRKKITLQSDDKIKETAITQNKLESADKAHVLDDHGLQCLLIEKNPFEEKRSLNIGDLELGDGSSESYVLSLLKSRKPPLTSIIHSEFSEKANKKIARLCRNYQLERKEDYRFLKLDEKTFEAFKGAKVTLVGFECTFAKLEHIETLTIQRGSLIHFETLIYFLNRTSNSLKQLDLFDCNYLFLPYLPLPLSLSLTKLKKLDLSCSFLTDAKISKEYIEFLLHMAPLIEELNLSGRNNLPLLGFPKSLKTLYPPSDIEFPELQHLSKLPALKELYLFGCSQLKDFPMQVPFPLLEKLTISSNHLAHPSLNGDDFQKLISESTKLRELCFYECPNILSFSKDIKFNVPLLEKMSYEGKVKGYEDQDFIFCLLQKLVSNPQGLSELYLTNCNINESDIIPFPALKKLVLKGCYFSLGSFEKLLSSPSLLKELDLSFSRLFYLKGASFDFQSLEKLDLSNTGVSGDDFEVLISHPILLIELNLTNCYYLKNFKSEFNFKSLKKLNLKGCSNLTNEGLEQLLKNSCELVELELTNCTRIKDLTMEFNLQSLKKLVLKECRISIEDLQKLIGNSPQITHLDLSNCRNLCNFKTRMEFNFSSLRTLELPFCGINDADLLMLLAQTSSLVKLDLTRCQQLSRLDPDTVDLSSLEQLSLFHSGINPECIRELLEKIPFLEIDEKERVAQALPEEVPHHFKNYLEIKPTDEQHFKFIFKNINYSLDQKMIVDKFSHYLTLTQEFTFLIPRIQDGICNALAHFSKDYSLQWKNNLELIRNWNGDEPTLTKKISEKRGNTLQEIFDALIVYILNYHTDTHKKFKTQTFLGDTLITFLKYAEKQGITEGLIFVNPWHAISVWPVYSKSKKHTRWEVYDPNFIEGIKTIDIGVQSLAEVITHSLGILVSVDGNYPGCPHYEQKHKHLHPDFILEGGLLVLCSNPKLRRSFLKTLPSPEILKPDVFDGLLIRTTKGKPAWVLGLQEPELKEYIMDMLMAFSRCPDYIQQLEKSLEDLSAKERFDSIVLLRTISVQGVKQTPTDQRKKEKGHHASLPHSSSPHPSPPTPDVFLRELIPKLQTRKKKDFAQYLRPWEKQTAPEYDLSQYCQKLFIPGVHKKCLIELPSNRSVEALILKFLDHGRSIDRPIFCINHPDDLVCSSPYIRLEENRTGKLVQGPGGPLFDFLSKGKLPRVLLINYTNFKPDEVVSHNSLLDDEPKIDNILLPIEIIVIGLINPNDPNSYQGEDFYSRFGTQGVSICPFSERKLEKPYSSLVTKIPKNIPENMPGQAFIDLSKSQDWEAKLLGCWIIKQDKLLYEEGALFKALRNPSISHIHIQNGLWEDKRFKAFLEQIIIRKKIIHFGTELLLDREILWTRRESYQWQSLLENVHFDENQSPGALILNPTTLNEFFRKYKFDNETKTLDTLQGHLFDYSNKSLEVNVTRDLSEKEWASLLLECKQCKVHLNSHLAPKVSLPLAMQYTSKVVETEGTEILSCDLKNILPSCFALSSKDVATTVAALLTHQPQGEWLIINISECHSSQLFTSINSNVEGGIGDTPMSFKFQERFCIVRQSLLDGKRILLYGDFSTDLIDNLAHVMLSPPPHGQLILVSNKTDEFHFNTTHSFTVKEKLILLKEQLSRYEWITQFNYRAYLDSYCNYLDANPVLLEESFHRLGARFRFICAITKDKTAEILWDEVFPKSENAWQGMEDLPIRFEFTDLKLEHSKKIADEFDQQRLEEVIAQLNISPYVFLLGPTGSGKTTFVEKMFDREDTVLYQGESQFTDWAKDTSSRMKILFIDEANLLKCQWTELYGLFNNPPAILIDKDYFRLSKHHKIIFAGNPLSYGGKRQLSRFFLDNGHGVVFKPLPAEYIYENILKPIFANQGFDEALIKDILLPILDCYRFICEHSKHEILISSRDLEMMALLTLSYSKRSSEGQPYSLITMASHYAFQLGKTVLPKELHAEFGALFPDFSLEELDVSKKNVLIPPNFIITPSRTNVVALLDNLLSLHELRTQEGGINSNDVQCYGGLGGVVIEGESGEGKSELVISLLRKNGYQEGHHVLSGHKKTFYRIPVGMQQEDKERLLCHAFNEGALVIIDEINSSPMMERLLYSLLMGKLKGQRPKKPGFLLIGTQNPVIKEGRLKPSIALARRLITLIIPPYSYQEMRHILLVKGIPQMDAEEMIQAYTESVNEARLKHRVPIPTFRDVLKLAEWFFPKTKEAVKIVLTEPIEKYLESSAVRFFYHSPIPPQPKKEDWTKIKGLTQQEGIPPPEEELTPKEKKLLLELKDAWDKGKAKNQEQQEPEPPKKNSNTEP